VDRSKQKKSELPAKTYEGAPGDYAGSIGGTVGTLTVPASGSITTSDPDEQDFIEQTLGWSGKVQSGSARSGSSKKE